MPRHSTLSRARPSATEAGRGVAPLPVVPTARHAVGSGRRIAGALLATVVGLGILVAFALAEIDPALSPAVAAATLAVGAFAIWGAARSEHARQRSDLVRLASDNLRLANELESLADTAWELRESEEVYRSLVDAQGDLVVRRDGSGRVTFVNPAFARAFNRTSTALVDEPFTLVPLTTSPMAAEAPAPRDVKLITVNGWRWYSWVDIRIRDEVYSVARDITARKEVEQALVDARQRAEAASQAKSRVLATVSHEFRTPLNGILGLTGLLAETELTPDQETYARAVHSSGEALLALVDDMLDFSKIEAGRLDLHAEPTDLEALLQEIVELLAGRAHVKGIDIAAEIARGMPAAVMVDSARLRQVLINLVGNGVKFTDRGGVTLSAEVAEGGAIAFAVSDTGTGIPPGEANRLFDEFEQMDTALSRRHGGAGLGLAISRRIVRRMGGEITVAPRAGGGSIFSFSLTLPAADDTAATAGESLAGSSFLILAPDGAEPPTVARHLEDAGGSARIVRTLVEAAGLIGAASAAGEIHAAVLIDGRIAPDPATALARVREAAGRPVPAAVLIEPGRRNEVEALRQAGFDAYLVRPVRRSSLLRIAGEIATTSGAGVRNFRIDPGDARPRKTSAPRRASTSLDVLVAEDNEINALLSRAVLEGLGHTVTEVRDGVAAVAAARAKAGGFPAILMDLHMPGMDGLAAARAIRAFEKESGIPRSAILAVTADVLTETRAAAKTAGIDAILEKPMTPDSLRRALAELTAA
jgi:signal transduction histidine kinase/CheY-like chemotaxis protein